MDEVAETMARLAQEEFRATGRRHPLFAAVPFNRARIEEILTRIIAIDLR